MLTEERELDHKSPRKLRSLSQIRLIYCGGAGFGQIFRSFSLNSPTIRLKRSKHLTQTSTPSPTIPNLGQAPRRTWHNTKRSHHHRGGYDFFLFHHARQYLTRLFCAQLPFLGSMNIQEQKGLFKKAASGVLGPLSCSRTRSQSEISDRSEDVLG